MKKRILCLMAAGLMIFTTCFTAAADTDAQIYELPKTGIDITIPESWTESGYYLAFNPIELIPEMFMTTGIIYSATTDELIAAEEKYTDEEELNNYYSDNAQDLFCILSVNDDFGYDGMVSFLAEEMGVSDPEEFTFEIEEIGKSDNWTFYNITGEEVLYRPAPPEGREETVEKILGDLPQMFENLKFYDPVEDPKTEVGTQISFKTVDFEGNEIDSKELFAQHDFTVVNLWMSWCGYCVEEMPELEKMNSEFAEDNCAVIGIMLDGDQEGELQIGKDIVEDTGVTYPMLIPNDDIREQLIAPAYPTTIIVNSEGVTVGEPIVGMRPDAYREQMQELIEGKKDQNAEEDTQAEAASSGDESQGYRIQVLDENGEPVPDVMVQFCSDTECMMEPTGTDGAASFDVEAGTYTIHILKVPEGYAEDAEEYTAPETPGTVEITLNKS